MKDDQEQEEPQKAMDADQMNDRTQNMMEKLLEMNENEEDLIFERPRSHSFPNLQYIDID